MLNWDDNTVPMVVSFNGIYFGIVLTELNFFKGHYDDDINFVRDEEVLGKYQVIGSCGFSLKNEHWIVSHKKVSR